MSVRLTDPSHVALYDSVTGTAFGLVFDSAEHARDFIDWLSDDAREFGTATLGVLTAEWRLQRIDPATGLLREKATA